MDSLRARQQRDHDAEQALKRLQAQVAERQKGGPRKKISTTPRKTKVVMKRRDKKSNKPIRKNKTRRLRYLKAEKQRINR
jgi:hypothetical protein